MTGTIDAIYRYPIKGLTAHAMSETALQPGAALPLDRAYAIEHGCGRFDASAPRTLDRVNFLTLMRDERLAALEARFEEADATLSLFRAGKQVARGDLRTVAGRAVLEQFFAAYMHGEVRGAPKIRHADGHSFADAGNKCVHLINLQTLQELERAVGRPVGALRFRPNFAVSGPDPWQEFSWLGRDIEMGTARLHVLARTERCAATNVDPVTATRDLDIPALLRRRWGHCDFGVYATVIESGTVRADDTVRCH